MQALHLTTAHPFPMRKPEMTTQPQVPELVISLKATAYPSAWTWMWSRSWRRSARRRAYTSSQAATYPDGDSNLIAYILIKDDTVSTPEGIDLSMTKDDVIAAYGEDYTAEGFETGADESDADTAVIAGDAGNGKLTYEKDGMTLNFFFDGENISSIEYDSGVLN
jgi:hypothetical protein